MPLVFLIIAPVSLSAAGGTPRHAEGVAPGTGRGAVEAALINAELAVIAEFVEDLSGTDDLTVFKPILERAREYIVSRVVTAQYERDGAAYAGIDAILREDLLKRDMGQILARGMGRRLRLLVLATEPRPDGGAPVYVPPGPAAAMLYDVLKSADIELVSPVNVPPAVLERMSALPPGDDKAAQVLAQEQLADAVVLCEISTSSEAMESGVIKATGTLQARIAGATDGASFHLFTCDASLNCASVESGEKEAASMAGIAAASEIITTSALAAASAGDPDGITVDIEGDITDAESTQIRNRIEGIPGVANVTDGEAAVPGINFVAGYTGGMADFVHRIVEPYEGFRLDRKQVMGRRMVLRLARQGSVG